MVSVYTDGGARGNPGPAAIGIIIVDEENKILEEHKELLGVKTNNQAEYLAIIKALELALKYGSEIQCYSDSELMINQLLGRYAIKNEELKKLIQAVKEKEKMFKKVKYTHVKRNNLFIKQVDKLVNNALDGR